MKKLGALGLLAFLLLFAIARIAPDPPAPLPAVAVIDAPGVAAVDAGPADDPRRVAAAEAEEVAAVEPPDDYRHHLPQEFVPFDARRLLGSPEPLPLEARRAFPALRFERPVELTHAGDGSNRLFVVELPGVIRVFENRDDATHAETFLDLRDVVVSEGYEEGLLGLAFHPRFKENGEFFVFYSARPRTSIVSRFRVSRSDPNRADRSSERTLLRVDRPSHDHNGGTLRFGPDGMLYIALGDGGSPDDSQGNGQSPNTLLASILRVDVARAQPPLEYAIPADNPYAGRRDARGEVWATGLRNVWRMAFDPATGELWAGDVGQHRFEEINVIVRGGNYGWNVREGFEAYQPATHAKPPHLIDPVVAYDRGQGESVTGGQVYRGRALPEFAGAYFYGDYVSGDVWIVRREGERLREHRQVASVGEYITAFGSDAAGELYLCTYDGGLFRFQRRDPDKQSRIAQAFPRKLSETGLFASVAKNEPAAGMIPYDVNVPFWSDHGVKDRYFVLPAAGSVEFDERGKWSFPVGTVFVKTIWMHRDRVHTADPIRLETRLLVNTGEGWAAHTYVYDEDQREARLLDAPLHRSVEIAGEEGTFHQPYYIPSRAQCFSCHTRGEGILLGLTTRQLNRTLHYRGQNVDQIALFDRLGLFREPIARPSEELERFPHWGYGNLDRSDAPPSDELAAIEPPHGDVDSLARAWLDVHCAVCHRPRGTAPHYRDFRFHASLEEMNVVGAKPNHGHLTLPGSEIVKPGRPEESELLFRMGQRGPRQMPPLATQIVDRRAVAIIREWIATLSYGEAIALEMPLDEDPATVEPAGESSRPAGD